MPNERYARLKEAVASAQVARDHGLETTQDGQGREKALCPFHDDHHPSLKLFPDGGWRCFVCDIGGDAIGLEERLGGHISPSEAASVLEERYGLMRLTGPESGTQRPRRGSRKASGKPVYYDYRDERGEILYRVKRTADKAFYPYAPDGTGGYKTGKGIMTGVRQVLYRLPELLAADPERTVYLCEGEKDAERGAEAGLLTVAHQGGSNRWRSEYAEHLRDRRVRVLPDNDPAGRKWALAAHGDLEGVAASVEIVELPVSGQGEDLADYLHAGGMAEELERLPAVDAEALREAPAHDPDRHALEAVRESENGRGPTVDRRVGGGPPILHLTDAHNAKRLAALHGERIRYIDPWRKFLVYDGVRWLIDDLRRVERWAKEAVPDLILDEARRLPAGSDERSEHLSWSLKSESNMRIKATTEQLKSEAVIAATFDRLDRDPWSLNVLNGTVDLRTGGLRPHDPEDFITKLAPVEYDPEAGCPRWLEMLERILPDPQVRRYVQKACGYSATAQSGQTADQILLVPHGMGANGKSTMLGTVADVLGDYAQLSAPDLLVQKRSEHPTALADLFGVRMLMSIETEENVRLNESLIKRLTGGERVRARRMREDFWEFPPTHTTWFAVNHKPEVRGTDHAIWRRVKLIPFTVQIPQREQNRRLREELRAEWPGIARWIVEGCVMWLAEGLEEPEAVRIATEEYRREQDVIGRFLEDCCVLHPDAEVGASALFRRYESWCDEQRETPKTQHKFGAALRDRGQDLDNSGRFTSGPNKGRTKWTGIGLISTEDDPGGGSFRTTAGGEPSGPAAAPSEPGGEPSGEEKVRAEAYKARNQADGEPSMVHSGREGPTKVHRENPAQKCGESPSQKGGGEPSEPLCGIDGSNTLEKETNGDEGSLGSPGGYAAPGNAVGEALGMPPGDDRRADAESSSAAPQEGDWLPGWEPGSERGGEFGWLRGETPKQKAQRMHAELQKRGEG